VSGEVFEEQVPNLSERSLPHDDPEPGLDLIHSALPFGRAASGPALGPMLRPEVAMEDCTVRDTMAATDATSQIAILINRRTQDTIVSGNPASPAAIDLRGNG
jgi:hypothetical protein